MRHLLVAVSAHALGEMALGLRLAWELHARGDEVLFLAPAAQSLLLRGTPFRHGQIDLAVSPLASTVAAVARERRCHHVVLVDLTSVYLLLGTQGSDSSFLAQVPVPVSALDVWDLAATDRIWDFGPEHWEISAHALRVTRLLIPVPFAAPAGSGRRYCALPERDQLVGAALERNVVRARLGLTESAGVVLLATGKWQLAAHLREPSMQRMAELVPRWLVEQLRELPLHLLHVGPAPLPGAEALGARYHLCPPTAPSGFAELILASDVLLSLNFSATSMLSALALERPVLLVQHSRSAAAPAAALSPSPGPAAALGEQLARLYPFAVWPLGLQRFLTPVMAGNPYCEALTTVELLDAESLRAALLGLCSDPVRRDEALHRQAGFVAVARALPSAAEALLDMVGPLLGGDGRSVGPAT